MSGPEIRSQPTLHLLFDVQMAVEAATRICTLCKCALANRGYEDASEAIRDALDHLTAEDLFNADIALEELHSRLSGEAPTSESEPEVRS